jgi:hypothetical protein
MTSFYFIIFQMFFAKKKRKKKCASGNGKCDSNFKQIGKKNTSVKMTHSHEHITIINNSVIKIILIEKIV